MNEATPCWWPVISSVPQSLILESILFNIFISDPVALEHWTTINDVKFNKRNAGCCTWDRVMLDTGAEWETNGWRAYQQHLGCLVWRKGG